MKKILLACLVALMGMGTASAQSSEQGVFNHLGIGVGVGTPGIGIDLSTCVTPYVGLRAGVNIMPQFKYSTDISINKSGYQAELAALQAAGLTYNIPDKVDVEGKLKNTTGHFLIDLYPGERVDWHLTVGAYFGGDEVVNVYTSDDSQLADIARFNRDYPSHKIGAQLGDFFLEPDANGHIDANIKTKGFRPYVGLGWGRAVPKNHTLGFQFDLGVQFWGTPKVYCQGNELKKEDVGNSDGGFMKTLTKITVYPTLNFRLVGKLF